MTGSGPLRRTLAQLVAIGLVCVATSCATGGRKATVALPAPERRGAVVFVAVGGVETSGDDLADPLRESWSQLFYRSALPRRAVHVNLAEGDATAADVLSEQVPATLELSPTVVTVWVGSADARLGTPLDSFEDDLERVLRSVPGDGPARVLAIVGPSTGSGDGDPYADGIRAVAQRTGVDVVDLSAIGDTSSVTAQETIADAVAEALGPVR